MTLTKSKLAQIKAGLKKPRILWGFAVSPKMLQALRFFLKAEGEKGEGFPTGVPIIVDPRMLGNDKVEAHFNHRVWMERVREQNKWDGLQNENKGS